jgi:HEAT repeat protein
VRRAAPALLLAGALACGRGGAGDALRSEHPERRAAAVAELATSRDDADLAVLLVAQEDPSPLVRKAAAGAFTARGGGRAVEGLARLLVDPDPDVVAAAARGMGAISHASKGSDARATAALQRQAAQALAAAYGRADAGGRAEIAAALTALGASLREAVDAEARLLWARDVRVLASGSPAERAGAAEELGRSGRADAVKRLLPLATATGADARLAAAAARGLGWTGDRSVREVLEDALLGGDAALAEAAAAALAALGDPAASEALAQAGTEGPPRIAAATVEALDALPRAPEVGVALCEIAVRSPDPAVAERAARAARGREADCPERPIVNRLARRGADAVAALGALGALGLPPDRLRAPAERAVALLQPGVEPAIRAAAARALGLCRFAPAVPALQRRLQALRERLSEQREAWVPGPLPGAAAPGFESGIPGPEEIAGRPLPGPGSAPGEPAAGTAPAGGGAGSRVLDGLAPVDAGDAEETGEVVVALARLGADASALRLGELARDPSPRLRRAAMEATASSSDPKALERLAGALADASPEVRLEAAGALGRRGATAAAPLAAALARTREGQGQDRAALARALGETGAPEAVGPLAGLLSGPEAPVAAQALGRLGTREAVAPLVALLERRQQLGRVEALEALAAVATAESGAAIAAELTSDSPGVRAAAAQALGRIRHAAASASLEALRGDYYASVRRAAVEALARLPSRPPGRP